MRSIEENKIVKTSNTSALNHSHVHSISTPEADTKEKIHQRTVWRKAILRFHFETWRKMKISTMVKNNGEASVHERNTNITKNKYKIGSLYDHENITQQ